MLPDGGGGRWTCGGRGAGDGGWVCCGCHGCLAVRAVAVLRCSSRQRRLDASSWDMVRHSMSLRPTKINFEVLWYLDYEYMSVWPCCGESRRRPHVPHPDDERPRFRARRGRASVLGLRAKSARRLSKQDSSTQIHLHLSRSWNAFLSRMPMPFLDSSAIRTKLTFIYTL